MRVLMLLTDAYGGHGGIALYNRDVLRALAQIDEVERIDAVPRISGPFDGAIPPNVRWHSRAATGSVAFVLQSLRYAAGLGSADILWCAHVNLLPLASLIRRVTGCRLILAVYGVEAWQPFERTSAISQLRWVDRVMAISGVTADRLVAWSGYPRERCTIIANAIDTTLYGDGPRDQGLVDRFRLEGKKAVLILGRMHPTEREKGFDELIGAMPALLAREPDLVAVLAGDGDDRPRLERLARETGVADAVRFTGRVEESEKASFYRLADAFVMPGRQEGFGFVHLEAMACGTPTVASRVDGSIEAVAFGQLGGLVDPDDPASIVDETLAALARGRGVPEGLRQFEFERFAAEVRAMIAAVAATPRAHH